MTQVMIRAKGLMNYSDFCFSSFVIQGDGKFRYRGALFGGRWRTGS